MHETKSTFILGIVDKMRGKWMEVKKGTHNSRFRCDPGLYCGEW